MGRLLRWLLFVLLLCPLLGPTSGAAQDGQLGRLDDPETYDLGAMLLTPEDLADEGLEGYALREGWTDTLDDELLGILAASSDFSEAELQELLEATGYQYSRVGQLDVPSEEDPAFAGRRVTNWINLHDGPEGLDQVLDALFSLGDIEDEEGTGTIGDYSRIVLFQDTDPDTGNDTLVMLLGFVYENFIGFIQVSDFQTMLPDADPTIEEIEALGSRLVERIDAVREAGSPRLDSLPMRLESDGQLGLIVSDFYIRLEGETRPIYRESDEAFALRDDEYEEWGITDAYVMDETFGPVDDGPILRWAVRLRLHESEEQAEAWQAGEPESSTARANVEDLDFKEIADVGDDGGVLATFTLPDSDLAVMTLSFRSGALTVGVQIYTTGEMIDEDVLINLGGQQLACLEEGGCDGEAPIPDEIGEYVES
jgi:hypothetical protein